MDEGKGYPVARKGLRFRQFPNGVLFENGIALNRTAFAILNLCDGRSSLQDMAGELARQFAIAPGAAEPHVRETVAHLITAGLVVREGE